MKVINIFENTRRFVPVSFILGYVKNQKIQFSILLMMAIAWSLNQILFPLTLKYIVNSVSIASSFSSKKVALLVAVQISIWILAEVMIRMQGHILIKALSQLRSSILLDIYSKVCSYSYSYFTQRSVGELTGKIGDISPSTERLVQIFIFNFVPVVVTILIALIMALSVSVVLFGSILCWFSVHVLLTVHHIKTGARLSHLHANSQFILSGKITDTIINIFNVKLFNGESYEQTCFRKFKQVECDLYKNTGFHYEKMKIFQSVNAVFFMIVVMSVLLYGFLHNTITPGDFALISMLSFNMVGFVWYLSFQMTIFTKEYSILSASLLVLDESEGENLDRVNIHIKKGMINFKDVDFIYNKNPILKNISVNIQSGEKIGIIGESGSGKSTFVSLIAGIHNAFSGAIVIDGQNINDFSTDSLRRQIAYIPQDCVLFNRTLMDNIRYGRLNASDQEVENAARLAACHDFIVAFEQGYNTEVGSAGVQLSGGQRQRILIARAILKDSPIYILDEATSSLDIVTEKVVQDNLRKLLINRTSIIVSHRVSSFEGTDRIFVFDKGRIVEMGAFKDLIRGGGHFFCLWQQQSSLEALKHAV
tara:strand:- start:4115 stop:5890 length:1776 start_codon:yes stop_codon:yes gene_type:complete